MSERQRADVWLFRARFAKTRAEAARLIAEGGVRMMRDGVSHRVAKPSAELAVGDALVFTRNGVLRAVRIEGLPARRGPPAEARTAYREESGV